MTDLTPRQLIDAIVRALDANARRFAAARRAKRKRTAARAAQSRQRVAKKGSRTKKSPGRRRAKS